MKSLNAWMEHTGWTVWDAKIRQGIFYDWRINAGLRADGNAWMGKP